MQFTLFTANCIGKAANRSYPNKVCIENAGQLQQAVIFDHVCASYKDGCRSNQAFLESDVIPMDIDNDHTDDPAEYITPEKMAELLDDVDYAMVPSRNSNKPKGDHPAAPRYHCFFAIPKISSAQRYAELKVKIQKQFPFFDGNALDAARFLFGCPADEVIWHEGWMSIADVVEDGSGIPETEPQEYFTGYEPIPEGMRNNTMSRFAGRVLKKYGISDMAREAFLEHAKRCNPPLPDEELNIIWSSAVRFYRNTVMTQPGYVSPEEYNAEFESLRPEDYSDIGEARALVQEYKGELLYTNSTEFLSYDGVCWQEDKQKAIGTVEEFLDMQLVDARMQMNRACQSLAEKGIPEKVIKSGGKALEKLITPQEEKEYAEYVSAKGYFSFVMKYRNFKNIVSTQNAAKPMIAADITMFDAQEDYLNTPDATFDLTKGMNGAMVHRPEDLLTKITSVSPGEEGRQLWEDALQLFFCEDQQLIEYVQETVGLAAIGKVYEEALVIAYGEGRNGKSTFWNTVSRVMGSYAGSISADTLTAGCRRNVKPEIAELKGKRLIIAAELEEGMRLSTSILKQLCSTDQIRGEKKYKDPFDFTPSHTVVLYTNHLPKVGASDDGTWRRLIVIPFHAKIEGKSDIKNYADYLYEHAAPAILTWIIEGARKVIAHGHKPKKPKVVENAIAEYRGMNDWMGIFLEECCEIGDGMQQKAGEFYQEYRVFCQRTGEYTRHNSDFVSELEKRGFVRKKTRTGAIVMGVRLKDETVLDFDT